MLLLIYQEYLFNIRSSMTWKRQKTMKTMKKPTMNECIIAPVLQRAWKQIKKLI